MIRDLDPAILEVRSQYLRDVRDFFFRRKYLEVETPLLNPTGSFEPFLDPLRVSYRSLRKSPQERERGAGRRTGGYLITSPEYNLKATLGRVRRNIFQIAHVFREGDVGELHTEEFLMLEWYHLECDDFGLMDEVEELLRQLACSAYTRSPIQDSAPLPRRSVKDLFREFVQCDLKRESLVEAVRTLGLAGQENDPGEWRYEELFFTLFLNHIEGHLGVGGPEFVHGYPRELAALSRVEEGVARRFELYWKGVELANGYYELADREEHLRRFQEENEIRRHLGKETMEVDQDFLSVLDGTFPRCSGIALGLDRLLMLLMDESKIGDVSPFY